MRTVRRLNALLEHSTEAWVIVDRYGQVCEWNPAAEGVLGWSRSEMISGALSDQVKEADQPAFCELWDELAEGGESGTFHGQMVHRSGEPFTVHLDLVSVRGDDLFEGVIGVLRPSAQSTVAEERDTAGSDRDDAGSDRDDAADRRDRDGMRRDSAGVRRDAAGQLRDHEGDNRDHAARERDRSAATRDLSGQERDVAGDLRDDEGVRRDLAGTLRDLEATRRDEADAHHEAGSTVGAGLLAARLAAADDRRLASQDRGAGATERSQAGRDRSIASSDRHAGAGQRTAAAVDRGTAYADRGAGADDRMSARTDRDSALHDRGAGADARLSADVDRQTSLADRHASARERENATVDDLTGTHRRAAGFLELDREISKAQRTGHALVVAFVDVDGLKAVNDSEGHLAGDRLLLLVADALRSQLRSHDLVIRYGGDEFVCVLPGLTLAEATERLASVNETVAPGSVSVGLAEARPDESSASVVERADAALYAARIARRRS
jgi:diguanylate cyclase (GGDEF)-like protein/PAS domain S-box-containing protein